MNLFVLTKTAGILGPVANLLGVIMDMLFRFTSSFGVINIGLCIILFTLVIKILMFPLTLQQQKSSKLMAVMQPEIQAIQKKYKGKTDNDSMMRQNVETKAVYEKYGTSMTGGCVQLLIQMPILFALYRVIYNIPAYVSSVRVYFDQVVNSVQAQPDYINKLTDIATAAKMPIDKYDFTIGDKLVDLLYKLDVSQWQNLQTIFPSVSDLQIKGEGVVEAIHSMQNFLGLNISYTPTTVIMNYFKGNEGGFTLLSVVIAIAIPLLAGASQWYTSKLMMNNQAAATDDSNQMAASMKSMTTMMPLMSVFFCFTFAAGIGIYWIASSVFTIIQQIAVNAYLDKVDMDEMIRKNVEKANAKRAKKGLPPEKINQHASSTLKNLEAAAEKKEKIREQKIEKSKEIEKESTTYYNANAKPGSLAAKAGMVAKYNEKHTK